MRVGIDARVLERSDDIRGIAVIVSYIIHYLARSGVDLVLFYSKTPTLTVAESAKSVVIRSLPDRLRHAAATSALFRWHWVDAARPLRNILWEQFILPIAIARERLDVFHAPANTGIPILGRGVFVATINDVIPLVTPYFFDSRPDPPLTTWIYRLWYRISLAVVAHKARRVLTLSECSRRDIERFLPRTRGKVRVVYPGADPRYRRVEDPRRIDQALRRYALSRPYIIYVGGIGQRKNLPGLLQAYATLVRRRLNVPALAIVGKQNALFGPLRRLAETLGVAEKVRFTGFVPIDDMPALLSSAEMLVYPSFYEGFGLPVVEAMACGCPVVCSGTSSLPEVGGDAVLYCDPARPEDIADQMERVLVDSALRSMLVVRGRERVQNFSMERMAAEVFSVYNEALSVQRT